MLYPFSNDSLTSSFKLVVLHPIAKPLLATLVQKAE